jgi:hypothetical protein
LKDGVAVLVNAYRQASVERVPGDALPRRLDREPVASQSTADLDASRVVYVGNTVAVAVPSAVKKSRSPSFFQI